MILTFELWPAMRLAVSEEWGGPDSADKRDYLISYLCDEHGNPGKAFEPDMDDLAETLESYVIDEFEARLDDGSSDWVAARILGLHRAIFSDDQDQARQAVDQLEKAYADLKGKKTQASAGAGPTEFHGHAHGQDEDISISDAQRMADAHGGVMDADVLGAQAGQQQQQQQQQQHEQPQRRERQEPIIDEDGFETVVSRRRR